jgi:hypothetical protein
MDGEAGLLTGQAVSRVGDMNGDGAADVLVLSSGQPVIGRSDSFVYVVFGFGVNTPRERILRLEDAVRELSVAGQLPRVRAFKLVYRLQKAIAALDACRTEGAIRRLRKFALRIADLGVKRELVLGDALLVARAAGRVTKELEPG